DSNRSFLPGSTIFWFFVVVTGLAWFVLGINLSFGRKYVAKILFYAAIARCVIPIVGWFFTWISISYYRKAKVWSEL
ncbi:MAG: hypothetical protein AB8C95_16020, partial [Phycisphaeraceae bacterium]